MTPSIGLLQYARSKSSEAVRWERRLSPSSTVLVLFSALQRSFLAEGFSESKVATYLLGLDTGCGLSLKLLANLKQLLKYFSISSLPSFEFNGLAFLL